MDRLAAQDIFALALQHHQAGRLAQAAQLYRQALDREPNHYKAQNNLGVILAAQGDFASAIALYQQSLKLKPDYIEALGNLGAALHSLGDYEAAACAHRKAIAFRPNRAEAYANLGSALYSLGKVHDSIAAYRQAIALRPEFAAAHHNLALSLLLAGQFEEGWNEYEWRWKWDQFPSPWRLFAAPRWDGSPLADRTILIHAEQGIGDTIQFARYLPIVAERGGRVVFECAPELVRLMRCVDGVGAIQIVPRDSLDERTLPPFDVHAPLMSLPRLLKRPHPKDAPKSPYISLADDLRTHWQSKLSLGKRLKIGLAWAGSPKHSEDRRRSIPFHVMVPLLQCEADFYSLQIGQVPQDQTGNYRLIDLTADIKDFLDTAGLISQLDLVITVDTAIAHLAGAMGKPTWLLLAFAPDWRWQLGGDVTDWYASVKLFRQSVAGDWGAVILRVAAELSREILNRA